MLSFGTFTSCALASARRSRGFIVASPPPSFAATVTSLMALLKTFPRFASERSFLWRMFAHLECPAMAARLSWETSRCHNSNAADDARTRGVTRCPSRCSSPKQAPKISPSSPGAASPKMKERLTMLKLDEPKWAGCPFTFWDVYAEQGHPVRATVSDMGPLLLARL